LLAWPWNPDEVNLLAYLEGEPTDSDAARVSELASRLRQSYLRKTPPAFVDEVDGEDRTVGLLAIIPPPGDDAALEEAALAEVVRMVEAIEEFTRTNNDVFAWELDGTVVGWVEAGSRDRLLEEGLIAPWRQQLSRLRN
jgi:hypothetical protein